MSDELKIKYWAGFLNSRAMDIVGWKEQWQEGARKAEQDGQVLAVFRIPIEGVALSDVPDGDAMAEIEKLLQKMFQAPKEGPPPGSKITLL